jgi:DNA-binding response OmpR family regulator
MREYQLLEHLVHHAGTVVTRTDLWEHVWDSHDGCLFNVRLPVLSSKF